MLFTLFCRLSSTLSLRLLSCHFIFTLSFWIFRLNLAAVCAVFARLRSLVLQHLLRLGKALFCPTAFCRLPLNFRAHFSDYL
ncbi:hypothetical protein, partial [Campylobacter rectus]|uniref:hypothetical protein n=1 Tax=Campylobacter rectus TaxID=203 RepID=UPI0028EA761B